MRLPGQSHINSYPFDHILCLDSCLSGSMLQDLSVTSLFSVMVGVMWSLLQSTPKHLLVYALEGEKMFSISKKTTFIVVTDALIFYAWLLPSLKQDVHVLY